MAMSVSEIANKNFVTNSFPFLCVNSCEGSFDVAPKDRRSTVRGEWPTTNYALKLKYIFLPIWGADEQKSLKNNNNKKKNVMAECGLNQWKPIGFPICMWTTSG